MRSVLSSFSAAASLAPHSLTASDRRLAGKAIGREAGFGVDGQILHRLENSVPATCRAFLQWAITVAWLSRSPWASG
jgi:hypothetical protein